MWKTLKSLIHSFFYCRSSTELKRFFTWLFIHFAGTSQECAFSFSRLRVYCIHSTGMEVVFSIWEMNIAMSEIFNNENGKYQITNSFNMCIRPCSRYMRNWSMININDFVCVVLLLHFEAGTYQFTFPLTAPQTGASLNDIVLTWKHVVSQRNFLQLKRCTSKIIAIVNK